MLRSAQPTQGCYAREDQRRCASLGRHCARTRALAGRVFVVPLALGIFSPLRFEKSSEHGNRQAFAHHPQFEFQSTPGIGTRSPATFFIAIPPDSRIPIARRRGAVHSAPSCCFQRISAIAYIVTGPGPANKQNRSASKPRPQEAAEWTNKKQLARNCSASGNCGWS